MILDLLYKSDISKEQKLDTSSKDIQNKNSSSQDENIKRSLLKTISWRVIGTLDTILISYLITGTITMALSIGSIELITKMGLYFVHERAWNKIKWGK